MSQAASVSRCIQLQTSASPPLKSSWELTKDFRESCSFITQHHFWSQHWKKLNIIGPEQEGGEYNTEKANQKRQHTLKRLADVLQWRLLWMHNMLPPTDFCPAAEQQGASRATQVLKPEAKGRPYCHTLTCSHPPAGSRSVNHRHKASWRTSVRASSNSVACIIEQE